MNAILSVFKNSGRAAFSTREFASLLGKRDYARLLLHRLKKSGVIVSVRNGWFAFPNHLPEAIACEVSKPAFVSFHSALYLHGLTTQTPQFVQLAVSRNAKFYFALGTKVKEYKVKRTQFNGFFLREGVLLASPEKAFADCLNLPRTCPEIVLREALPEVQVELVKKLLSKQGLKRLKELVENA